MLTLEPAKWSDYQRFVDLCCVPTMPFHGGKCWTVKGDIAFIGYNFCFRNNQQRNLIFPQYLIGHAYMDLSWLNKNIRCLNRVMVRPEHRGKGIATQLVRQTLPMVKVPYIECLAFAQLIRTVLLRCNFIEYGQTAQNTCNYYLWTA